MPRTPAPTQATDHAMLPYDRIAQLEALDQRLLWLSAWTIHNANHLRESVDGIKVGGHQASCASMTAIMAALYFHALGPNDRVAVKPHAGPLLHAIHYLLGNQSVEALQQFRGFGGAQSYPSRTKDAIPVDFSTGSVGLGVAITAFASLVQDWMIAHGLLSHDRAGRMIALMGDAELDEGNIYECLIEGYKHDLRNCWWIVDYNRQSLDATTADRMFRRFDDIFETCGWRVVTLKHGKLQRETFARPGGQAIADWIDACPNADYAALTFKGGAAWRERLTADLARHPETLKLIGEHDDTALQRLMTTLGGHCLETLAAAFDTAKDERNTLFIAYTIKGHGLPLAGHKDNHAGLMTPGQIEGLRDSLGIAAGAEWEPWAGLGANAAAELRAFAASSAMAAKPGDHTPPPVPVPAIPVPEGATQSTQGAFGKILFELAKDRSTLADRVLTTSPDVTVSTNLGAFVNSRGLFRRQDLPDVFRQLDVPSPQKWQGNPAGQHVELGIAEHNLFLMLAAAGLAGPLFGERLIPIGTVYDPFIARGLDALNYGCYQDARFLLIATPSGLTLGGEGGAHQSINPPLIAMGQPGLTHYEPATADELALLMEHAFRHLQEPDGGSIYLRLSTRTIDQPARADDAWKQGAIDGAYWRIAPTSDEPVAIVAMGAMMPEALEAHAMLAEDMPGLGLLQVTSPSKLHRDWSSAQAAFWRNGTHEQSKVEKLLGALPASTGLVTVCDAAPGSLSWMGGVLGNRVSPLGTDRFGQTGTLPNLYREYRLDAEAIVEAAAGLIGGAR
jgi:pyruvate dehydrogenase E1 component